MKNNNKLYYIIIIIFFITLFILILEDRNIDNKIDSEIEYYLESRVNNKCKINELTEGSIKRVTEMKRKGMESCDNNFRNSFKLDNKINRKDIYTILLKEKNFSRDMIVLAYKNSVIGELKKISIYCDKKKLNNSKQSYSYSCGSYYTKGPRGGCKKCNNCSGNCYYVDRSYCW